MRSNEFIWTDLLGVEHKVQVDFAVHTSDEGSAYLAKTNHYIDSVIDGNDSELRVFCENIAHKCLRDIMSSRVDNRASVADRGNVYSSTAEYNKKFYEKSNAMYFDVLKRAEAEIIKQYPDLIDDIDNHNAMIEESRERLETKYNS